MQEKLEKNIVCESKVWKQKKSFYTLEKKSPINELEVPESYFGFDCSDFECTPFLTLCNYIAVVQSVCKYFFSCFRIFLFGNQSFKSYSFFINFSYFVIRFYYRAIKWKSDNEIGKVNDKKKYDLKIW